MEIAHVIHPALRAEMIPGVIEVEQHHDAGFGIETRQRDESDPDGDAHVVAEQVEEPERADQRKRHGEQDDRRSRDGTRVKVEQHENDQQRERDHELRVAASRASRYWNCPAHSNVMAGAELNSLRRAAARCAHIAVDVARGDIDKDKADELAAFAADDGGPVL